nr:hypothetical protein [Tanacetum cinerariifolium]
MVTVPIHQAFTSIPPLSTPIIDLSPPKPVASPLLEPFIAETTETTIPLPPTPQQQNTTDSELATRVTTLEKKFSDFEQKSTTQNLRSSLQLHSPQPGKHLTLEKLLLDPLSRSSVGAGCEQTVTPRRSTRDAFSISKLKAANYPNFRLEELVLSLWIESERDYNISAAYGITHWNIVIRKCVGDLQLGIKSYQTKLNLAELRWDASEFLFKEDYTIVSKPRTVIYIDRNDQKKMMKENEVHKFSDGTLTRVLHKLNHMVKDFRLYQYNPGMENRIWSEDDKRRSEEFMENIRVIPKYHGEDGNHARANIKQALEGNKKSDHDVSAYGLVVGDFLWRNDNDKTTVEIEEGYDGQQEEIKEDCVLVIGNKKSDHDVSAYGLVVGDFLWRNDNDNDKTTIEIEEGYDVQQEEIKEDCVLVIGYSLWGKFISYPWWLDRKYFPSNIMILGLKTEMKMVMLPWCF